MTDNGTLKYLESLHSKIIRSSFAKNVTENEIMALIECKKMIKEIQKYRAIGTVEECREARERRREKKPIISHIGQVNDRGKAHCPNCRQDIHGIGRIRHCFYCGQFIDWSE